MKTFTCSNTLWALFVLLYASFVLADEEDEAVVDRGIEISTYSVNIGSISGSGAGSGSWQATEDESGKLVIAITDTSTVKTAFSTTNVKADVDIWWDEDQGGWAGTSTPLDCSGTCTGVELGVPTSLYAIEVNLDEDNLGTITHKIDRDAGVGNATTTATYQLTYYGDAYIVSSADNTMTVVDTATFEVIEDNIELSVAGSGEMAADLDRQIIYIANSGVTMFSSKTNQEVGQIFVGDRSDSVIISPDYSRLYVTLRDSGQVAVINTAEKKVIKLIDVGEAPVNIVRTSDGSKAYVANSGSDTVSVLNLESQTVTGTIEVEKTPVSLALAPDDGRLYVGCEGANAVYIHNTQTGNSAVVSDITGPKFIAFSTEKAAYVASDTHSKLYVFDAENSEMTETIDLPGVPTSMMRSPDGSTLYFAIADEEQPQTQLISFDTGLNAINEPKTDMAHTGMSGMYLAPVPNIGKLKVYNNAAVMVRGKCNNEDGNFNIPVLQSHTCKDGVEFVHVWADINQTLGDFYPKQDCPTLVVQVNGTLFGVSAETRCDS